MDKIVGIIGLGIMGGAMAANLVERGWTVVGFDIDERRRSELAAVGVRAVESVAAVAAQAPILITSLPSPIAAEAVAREIAASGASQRIVAETSTLALADKLAIEAILSGAGHIPLDCPLSGTGAQARNRDLIVYASGDSAAIQQCIPLFTDFAKQSADLGAYGNGSKMKFIANHLVAIHNVAAAEAMVLARKAGLDLGQVVEMVGPGAGGSRMFQMRAPMMAEGRYEPPTMRVATWKKDMEIIAAFAQGLGCPTPLFTRTEPVYSKALQMGLGDLDTAAVCIVLEEEAGGRA
jgi:3-hydroxyisobutyrate dehydrogenase-like beta-hydroxyacid dehydrogenase